MSYITQKFSLHVPLPPVYTVEITLLTCQWYSLLFILVFNISTVLSIYMTMCSLANIYTQMDFDCLVNASISHGHYAVRRPACSCTLGPALWK